MEETSKKIILLGFQFVILVILLITALKAALIYSFVLFMVLLITSIGAPGKYRKYLLIASAIFLALSFVQQDGKIPLSYSEITKNFQETIQASKEGYQTGKDKVALERAIESALMGQTFSITNRGFGESLAIAKGTTSDELKKTFLDNSEKIITHSRELLVQMGPENVALSRYTPATCHLIHEGLIYLNYDNTTVKDWLSLASLVEWRNSEEGNRRRKKWPELHEEASRNGFKTSGDLAQDFSIPALPF